ncbi:hypothetical protein [Leifsonia sp. NPDC077715]|uniref:hypothetical protein n=1 Tax=Leifsonia sp. NPDC077715 TaxID=3155539 RepID=UPI003436E5A5
MVEALHLGSMLPATLGACCLAGGRDRRSATAWLGMLAMLAAMTDTMVLPAPLLPAVAWAALLVALAIATAARTRQRAGDAAGARDAHRTMGVHRSLQGLLMAGLLLVMSAHPRAGHATTEATLSAHVGHTAGAAWLPLVLGAAALAFSVYSAWLVARPRTRRLDRAEAALGGLAVAAMAVAALV